MKRNGSLMTLTNLTVRPNELVATWSNNTSTQFPTIWLRDNCPSGLHPKTQERMFDLLAIDEAPVLQEAQLEREFAVLT